MQSEIADPFEFYSRMLEENPVHRDQTSGVWAIYSYDQCKTILEHPFALIPPLVNNAKIPLNEYAQSITGSVVRLRNGEQHRLSRQITMLLFSKMQPIPLPEMISWLIPAVDDPLVRGDRPIMIDWVATVCMKLPVLAVLRGFGFNEVDSEIMVDKIGQLVTIMLAHKTDRQVVAINGISEGIYKLAEEVFATSGWARDILNPYAKSGMPGGEDLLSLCVGNLIGLIIQGYEAGRGLLSNTLLQILLHRGRYGGFSREKCGTGADGYDRGAGASGSEGGNQSFFYKSVMETLRFDPPVHNTRRVAGEDIVIDGQTIRKGESILVVLAAANRDPRHFDNPNRYDIHRKNNDEHMTFGDGHHMCLAKYFSTAMTAGTVDYLFSRFPNIELIDRNIEYEPKLNVRLPKRLLIGLS